MTVAGVATSQTMKLMKLTLSIFRPRFNSSKCKTAAKMAVARIKLLRNKREVVVRQMRKDIALLLQSGQDATARVRVEHVIREQNVLAANEFIELFCELVVSRLTIIAKRRECPADLKEGIASLIFAAPRCSEIPELVAITKIFEKKYGRDFISAAADLRPDCGVNRILIDKLSVITPTGEFKLKVMKEIAKEHQIEWDTSETEKELLKAPEERIEGPTTFVSASSLPVNVEPSKLTRPTNGAKVSGTHFGDTASAAQAAAESAKQAIAAAQAAAYLASQASGFDPKLNASSINLGAENFTGNSTRFLVPHDQQFTFQIMHHQSEAPGMDTITHQTIHGSKSFDRSAYNRDTRTIHIGENFYRMHSYSETRPVEVDGQNVVQRHSYSNVSPPRSHIISDEEMEMEECHADVYPSPERSPPPVPSFHENLEPAPRVHTKLQDYDALAARFEALKYSKS